MKKHLLTMLAFTGLAFYSCDDEVLPEEEVMDVNGKYYYFISDTNKTEEYKYVNDFQIILDLEQTENNELEGEALITEASYTFDPFGRYINYAIQSAQQDIRADDSSLDGSSVVFVLDDSDNYQEEKEGVLTEGNIATYIWNLFETNSFNGMLIDSGLEGELKRESQTMSSVTFKFDATIQQIDLFSRDLEEPNTAPVIEFSVPKKDQEISTAIEKIEVKVSDDTEVSSANFKIINNGVEVAAVSSKTSGKEVVLIWENDGSTLTEGSYELEVSAIDNDGLEITRVSGGDVSVLSFKASHDQIYFRGGPNSWGTSEFELIADHTWTLDSVKMINLGNVHFKLTNTDNWTHIDWGEREDANNDIFIDPNGHNLFLKEIEPIYDPETGEKIDDTIIRGGNTTAIINTSNLQEGEWYYRFTFIDIEDGSEDQFKLTFEPIGPTGN